jgi:quercetin dioxygenase-like cupin family protein
MTVIDPSAAPEPLSLVELAAEHLAEAHRAAAGRSSARVHGGHTRVLRQTLIALVAGASLDEHESPADATLQVLRGRVRLTAEGWAVELGAGERVDIPPTRHALAALDDSAVLLTTVVLPA